jgi:hypothetical protein
MSDTSHYEVILESPYSPFELTIYYENNLVSDVAYYDRKFFTGHLKTTKGELILLLEQDAVD